MRFARSAVRLLLVTALAGPSLVAQCTMQFLPGAGTNGPAGKVFAVLPLPNGDVIAGGDFARADRVSAHDVARWDGFEWQPLGTGTGPITTATKVLALARMPNGDLVAAGDFTTMDGQPCARIARWNGTSWLPIGSGINGPVSELLVMPNGDLIAAGTFNQAGTQVADRIARWDGSTWSAVGNGLAAGAILGLAVLPNGDLVVGGTHTLGLMRLVAGAWQSLPGFDTTFSSTYRSLAVLPNGSLAVSGNFRISGVVHGLAIVTGAVATPFPQPFASTSGILLAAANGDLVYGGDAANAVLGRWNGTSWSTWSGTVAPVVALGLDSAGRVVVGAAPEDTGFPTAAAVARFDGTLWQTLGGGPPPLVNAAVTLANGDVVCGGVFTTIGGVAAANIARWNGTDWAPLGAGVDGRVTTIAVTTNDALVVGGDFAMAGGAPAQRIARWNGASWSSIGGGLTIVPMAVAELTNGEIVAGAGLGLNRWDGAAWTSVLLPGAPGTVRAIAPLPDGSAILVGGFFGGVAVVSYANGATSLLSGAPTGVGRCVLRLADGSLVVSHNQSASHWDGSVWTPLPPVSASGLARLPNGGMVGCGGVSAFTPPSAVYRLAPIAWQPFGELLGGEARCIATTPRGEILVGGTFTSAGGFASAGFARAVPTCPGTATVVGAGCNGLAGPIALESVELPFVGGHCRTTATGLFANSVALALAGTPSPAFAVPGAPGCFGYLAALASDLLFPVAGTATVTLPIPSNPAVLGVQLRLQVAAIEFGAITRIATTNALDLTVGTLGL
jgi:hypothetical protein